ncbi:MAG: hypothetical protein BGO70_12390 [Bacteroidetes bacterium 43-93]|nr:TlpA family protein disulfide reductase [Bacteroidota bacterium]OJW98255.1 MAG: hypothetical protein BGO70_12390 [Bacteroidetes bacterium 43-93]
MKKLLGIAVAMCITFAAHAQYENEKIHVGQMAPELRFPNPKGDTLTLSELNKKRIILLDFWASWCGPCRHANPRLVQIYEQYKDKKFKMAKNGFDIVSVSLDKDKNNWIKAIENDKLTWPNHMSDLGAWNSKTAEVYGITFIPQAFLIGPDGKIWRTYTSTEAVEADLDALSKGVKIFDDGAGKN